MHCLYVDVDRSLIELQCIAKSIQACEDNINIISNSSQIHRVICSALDLNLPVSNTCLCDNAPSCFSRCQHKNLGRSRVIIHQFNGVNSRQVIGGNPWKTLGDLNRNSQFTALRSECYLIKPHRVGTVVGTSIGTTSTNANLQPITSTHLYFIGVRVACIA